jgi:hypothetical protein
MPPPVAQNLLDLLQVLDALSDTCQMLPCVLVDFFASIARRAQQFAKGVL